MIIAIDYDGTYSSDPSMFDAIIHLMKAKGHQVILVTGRSEEFGLDVKDAIGDMIPIVFAGTKWKRVAAMAAGYDVNIWIDDNPEYIDIQKNEFAQHKITLEK